MTVPNTTILSGPYLGNGVADTFEFAFTVMEASEVLVVMTDDDGVETTLELTTDYTVDVSGKTITLVAGPLPVDYLLIIKSQIVPLQLTNFSSQGAFYPEIHEAAFDKLTRVVQQHQEETGRSLRVTSTVGTHVDTILPTPAARRALIWNETGDALTMSDSDPDAMVNEAAASAVEAAASELAAGISEVNAAASELAAGTSENNAAASEAKAQQWAEEDQGVEVETGQYSAKHWAGVAQTYGAEKESALGNPDEDGKVLSSTAAGVRSWVSHPDSEAPLGNPDEDGKVLSSSAAGVRSWVAPYNGPVAPTAGDTVICQLCDDNVTISTDETVYSRNRINRSLAATCLIAGTIRVKLDHSRDGSANTGYVRIMKNGTQVVEWTITSSTMASRQQDIEVNVCDFIEVQQRTSGSVNPSRWKNVRICSGVVTPAFA